MSLVATAMLCPGTVRECAGCSKSAAASPRGNSGVDPFTRRDLKPCVLEVLKNYAQSIVGNIVFAKIGCHNCMAQCHGIGTQHD